MKIRSVTANYALNLGNTILSLLYPLITFPYITRILGAAGYGTTEFALQTVSFFSLFALLGVNVYGTRECAKVRNDKKALSKVTQELFTIISISTTIVAVIYVICIFAIPSFNQYLEIFALAGLFLPLNTLALNWFISANEQYLFVVVRSLLIKIVTIILMFLFIHSQNDILLWVGIYVFAEGAANIFNFFLMKKNTKFTSFKELEFKKHAKPMVLFFLASAAITIYTCLDSVMLGAMTSTEEVAYYQIPAKIKTLMVSVIAALAAVIVARSSFYLANNKMDEFNKLINSSIRLVIMYAPLAAIIVALYAAPIIELFAGPGYTGAILPLQLMMPAVVFICFTNITAQELMTPLGFEKQLTITYTIAAITDFALNLILIPQYGAIGATVSTTIAEALVLIAQSVVLFKHVDKRALFKNCMRIVIVVGATIVLCFTLWKFLPYSFISAVITSLVSFAFLYIFLLLIGEEIARSLPKTLLSKIKNN